MVGEGAREEPETEIFTSMLNTLNECIQVGDCLGTLIKAFKASFLPFIDELSSYITPIWVVPAWLSCLPIKGDLIEAKLVHDQLCSMVET
ncbi:hypothetical protein IFM89_019367 [Coptis chinensis]|uniref:Uncharacterized protein n=1 Tax=Coptis chinensis TaxID=261450 RepID=A0A835ICX8_9MAGN|nr:hypothetical protein IFM89_019367 [Coptis chinensis]